MAAGAALIGIILGSLVLLFVGLIFLLILYVYSAFTLMTIAKKTKTEHAWFAWVPFLNIYLVTKIGKVSAFTLLVFLIMFVPYLNILASPIMLGMMIYWFWKVCDARGKPGVLSLVLFVPILGILFLLGYLAWSE
jgi:hypothetical protein